MSFDALIAAEREVLSPQPVRRKVAVAPAPDPLGPRARSMGELTFLIWDRERRTLPSRVRSKDFHGMMISQRYFSTDLNLVAIAEDRLPALPDQLPAEILVPFYLLDPLGETPAEVLYQPALPFDRTGDVLRRLCEATGQQYVLSDSHLADQAAFHMLSATERAIIYALPHPAPHVTVQVNNYLVFLTEHECEGNRAPRIVTDRILEQLRQYSGLEEDILRLFEEHGVLVDERGRSLRRLARMMLPGNLPAFPNENVGARWLFRFRPNNQGVRLPMWDEHAIERPPADMLATYRGYQKLQEDWVDALNRTYRTLRSLVHVTPYAVIERDPTCPWKGRMRYRMEFAIHEGREAQLHYDIVSALFPERFPRWDVLFRATMATIEGRTEYPRAEQPGGLGLDLFPYQLDTLGFLLAAENLQGMHEKLWVPVGELFYAPCFQRVRPSLRDVVPLPRGGFLCEEVGLGKTIEILALVRANPAPEELPEPEEGRLRPSRATVVVCPVTIVAQWIQMIERNLVRPSADVVLYHGTKKVSDLNVLAEAEIVLTTYETLAKEFQKKQEIDAENEGLQDPAAPRRPPPPMYALEWHRTVFDEAHTVRSEGSSKALACSALVASRRWCMTATPFREEATASYDLRAQCGMLHPTLREVPMTWRSMLYSLAVRHNKEQVQALMPAIPPKREHVVAVAMADADRAVYQEALQKVQREYLRVRALMQDTAHVQGLMRYMHAVFQPLRVFCSTGRMPPIPIREDLGAVQEAEVVEGEVPDDECPICFTAMEEPHRTPCMHWFCRACIHDWLTAAHGNHKCPMCRRPITLHQLVRVVRPEEAQAQAQAAEAEAAAAAEGPAPVALEAPALQGNAAKLNALLDNLDRLRREEPDAKFLLFSQFRDGLQELQSALQDRGIGFRRIDGGMTLLRRARAIRDFESDDTVACMILDVRTASFGLNLTRAHHVMFLDTPANPAAVQQAVGRAHRTGQRREVQVHHYVLEGTIEERILREGITTVGFPEIVRLLAV